MEFGSDVTDKLQLPPNCVCGQKRTSYEQLLRIRRACINRSYDISGIPVVGAAGASYMQGDYIELEDGGKPPALLYVSGVTGAGAIRSVTLINVPKYATAPVNPVTSTKISGAGYDATFTVTVKLSAGSCCSC